MVVGIFATMDKGQEAESVSSFPRRWIAVMLTQCRTVGGLLRQLRKEAGLHPRYTSIDVNEEMTLDKFIRIEMNKGMSQNHHDFMREWTILGEQLYEFGNEYGDEFNKLHKMKKKKNAYEREERRFAQEELAGVQGHGGGY